MNTPTLNYQIDYGNVAQANPTRAPADAPLYASEDGVVASLSNNECIFQVKRTGDTHVMTFQVLQALDQSREFRTQDEHVARILATVPGLNARRDDVARVLDNLVAQGLLVSDQTFLARIGQRRPVDVAPFRAVFIRACDRPAQLAQLLTSLADYERRFHASRHYVLLDDSATREAADRHRDLLREFARETGCKLTYIGAAERERLVARIRKALPAIADVLPHLLMRDDTAQRFGGGRGWNLALLLSAGARLALLDDDHRLPLRRPDDARSGLDPNPAAQAVTRFYRNIENALGAGDEVGADPFDAHLEAVGHVLGEVSASADYRIDRESLRGLALSRLDHLTGAARILATHHGSYGSSRTESGAWLYRINAADRAEFHADRDAYLRNVEAGSIWYGYLQARATQTATFTPFMLDNSIMLPCVNAVGRGEDALFASVAHACHPDTLSLELPLAIGHVQEAQRKRSPFSMAASTPRFNYFISDFVQRALPAFNAESPAQRLHLLAAHMRDVAGASETGRLRQLREYLAYSRADLIESLQFQFDAASDAPVFWQADVRSMIQANGRALIAKDPPRLGDWPAEAGSQDCARLLREDSERLASAFEAWPAMWDWAREQGPRLLATI